MQAYRKIGLLLLILAFALTTAVYAQVDRKYAGPSNPRAAGKVSDGECTSNGSYSAEIDINNVRAALYNNGNLFYNGPYLYEVPKGSGHNAIFATSLWVGGKVNGELRMAASTYENYEFRPGPLFEDGSGPSDCAPYDHIWKVNKTDVQAYDAGEGATSDLSSWPTGLGAPTIDANGNEVIPTSRSQVINLGAGERPKIFGDQTLWWVMNDVSAPHDETLTNPIGLEAQVTAFAFNQAGALGHTTFYKYKLTYRGTAPLEDAYVAIWSDPDLGGAGDDRVGSDSTLGIGYVYNGDNSDTDYGGNPPAVGYDFFQGPLVDAPGETWTDPDGTEYQDKTRLGMSIFGTFTNGLDNQEDPAQGNPGQYYGYMSGFWQNGDPFTKGGTGLGFSTEPINYIYPDFPPSFWSEENIDGQGTSLQSGDRRLYQSTGPFTMNPGDVQEIVFGVVWSQAAEGASDPRLASLQKLFRDDELAQTVFDLNFELPDPPDAPQLTATPLDSKVLLTWEFTPQSNNYGASYSAVNPLLSDVEDVTYDFEGFILYQFNSPGDTEGNVVAVFDKPNDVNLILQENPDGTVVVDVPGEDKGLKYSYQFDNLTNYQTYYFGVQSYAYNPNSSPKTYKSAIRRVTVVPSRVDARDGGTILIDDALGASPDTVIASQGPRVGTVSVRVVNPAQITGHTYRVEYKAEDITVDGETETITVYDIIDVDTGKKVFDGSAYAQRFKRLTPLGEDIFVTDGLSFSIIGPEPKLDAGVQVDDDGNVIDSNLIFSLNAASTRPPTFFLTAQGAGSPSAILGRNDWQGGVTAHVPVDYELRFTDNPAEEGQLIWDRTWDEADPAQAFMIGWTSGADPDGDGVGNYNEDGTLTEVQHDAQNMHMPFSVWELYPDGTERQVQASILDDDDDRLWDINTGFAGETFGNAPGAYERIYIRSAAYDEDAMLADPVASFEAYFGEPSTVGRILIVPFGGDADIPSPAVNIRYVSTKPNEPGDTFTFDTAEFAPTRGDQATAEAALDMIGIVPNPYKGASAYEVTRIQDVVRFINLPERATIRVFTLNGTLIRTLEKDGPDTFMNWDLQTDSARPLASGMYLIHVETDIGERVLKFGVVKKRVQLNEF